jgi:DNA-binding MarR family transcriptional regulator
MRINMSSGEDEEADEARIVRAVLRLARALRGSARAAEVTGGALGLLATLYRSGPLSAVALARAEGLQPQSLSRLLVRLETDGLIARTVDEDDRRRHVITLTPRGLGALGWSMGERRRWLAQVMHERLSEAERATLAAAADIMLRIAGPLQENENAGE